jgi:hypothetical protein
MPLKNYTHYNDGMHQVQTLGQRLSHKEKNLAVYACNIYADQIANLDLMLLKLDYLLKNPELSAVRRLRIKMKVDTIKIVREELIIRGSAAFIKRSDILTQLSIRVGKTGSRDPISGSR